MAVGERAHHAGPSPDLPVEPLDCVVGAYPRPVLQRETGVCQRLEEALANDLRRLFEPHPIELRGNLAVLMGWQMRME